MLPDVSQAVAVALQSYVFPVALDHLRTLCPIEHRKIFPISLGGLRQPDHHSSVVQHLAAIRCMLVNRQYLSIRQQGNCPFIYLSQIASDHQWRPGHRPECHERALLIVCKPGQAR